MWRNTNDRSQAPEDPVSSFEDARRVDSVRRAITGNLIAGLVAIVISRAMGASGGLLLAMPLLALHGATFLLLRRHWSIARVMWLVTVHTLIAGVTVLYGYHSHAHTLWVATIPLTYVVFHSKEHTQRALALSVALILFTSVELLGNEGMIPGVIAARGPFFPLLAAVLTFLAAVQRSEALSDFHRAARACSTDQNQRLEEAQATAHVGGFTTDLATRATLWSQGMFLVHGFNPARGVPDEDSYLTGVQPEDRPRVREALERALDASDDPPDLEFRVRADDGPRTVAWSARFVRDANGKPVRLTGSVKDITEQRRNEAALVRAREAAEQASQSKSMFLANMSHELRTPMNGVLGMTALALDTTLSPAQREYLTSAHASGIALLTILNDILDLSKIEAGKLTLEEVPFSIRTVVRQSIQLVELRAIERDLQLTAVVDDDVPQRQKGDPVRVRQLLVNLLGNAVKFTDKGFVRLEVSCEDSNPDRLALRVVDTGVGIPEDRQRVIFEAFTQADGSTTRRFGGTGLGLTICGELVRLMNGSIEVQSALGEGSTFCAVLELPRTNVNLVDHAIVRVRPITGLQTRTAPRARRVLLAEDNAVNARIATRLVEKLGHQVVHVSDGQAALDALAQEHFDAVLMDVQMPTMDGFEAARRVRERERETGQHIAIVAMTASAMKGDEEACLAAGMDAYLSKPLNFTAVFEMLSRYVVDPTALKRSGEHPTVMTEGTPVDLVRATS